MPVGDAMVNARAVPWWMPLPNAMVDADAVVDDGATSDIAASAKQDKLHVRVVASCAVSGFSKDPERMAFSAQDEEIPTDIHMPVNLSFQKLMEAWCSQSKVELDAAEFEHNGDILRPDETPSNRGWTLEHGIMVVHVWPRRLLVKVVAEIAGREVSQKTGFSENLRKRIRDFPGARVIQLRTPSLPRVVRI